MALTPSVSVSFESGADADPWALNAWIREDPAFHGFAIETTAFTPPTLMALCHRVAARLFRHPEGVDVDLTDPRALANEIGSLAKMVLDASETCRKEGLGPALVKLRDGGGFTLLNAGESANIFDAAVQFIVCHEAGHAYVRQFARLRAPMPELDRKAFELLADLTATSWLYRRFIVNTPDTPEYRRFRRVRSHAHALRMNVRVVLESQIVLLLFLGFSEVLVTRSPVRFKEGPSHPHTMLRYLMQQTHFMTLVLSNFRQLLGKRQLAEIDEWWSGLLLLLTTVGLLPYDVEAVLTSDDTFAAVRRAGELVDEIGIEELRKAAPFLRTLTALGRAQTSSSPNDILSFDLAVALRGETQRR